MQVNGLTLLAGPSNGIYRIAELVQPDGQRNDAEPVVLVGDRLQDTKLYRGHLKGDDETIISGPYFAVSTPPVQLDAHCVITRRALK